MFYRLMIIFSLLAWQTCFAILPAPIGGQLAFYGHAGAGRHKVFFKKSLFLSVNTSNLKSQEDPSQLNVLPTKHRSYQFQIHYQAQTQAYKYPPKQHSIGPILSQDNLDLFKKNTDVLAGRVLEELKANRDPYLFFLSHTMQQDPFKHGNPYGWLYAVPIDFISLPITATMSLTRLVKDMYFRPKKLLRAVRHIITEQPIHSYLYLKEPYVQGLCDVIATL